MQDLIDLLGSLRETDADHPASAEMVVADVARARRARARRRTMATTAVAAVAAVAVTAVGTGGGGGGAAVASAPSAAHQQQAASVQLVAYTGAQPAGFTVTTVPSGWTVRASDAFAFVVEPSGSSYHAKTGAGDFVNAITVMLQGDSSGPSFDVASVSVNGHPGKLGLTQDKGATWLVYPDGAGHRVLVQVPVDLRLTGGRTVHLTNDQIVQFADGITVTGAAQAGKG